ncbi:MAG: hypothetical protein J6A33_05170 [Alphaproteobacteria bacterium]|nr:hypothetical protein [Alphaproteobacteria bacterium]
MINTKYLLLASVCVLLNGNAQASEVKNLTFDYSGSPLVNTHTYTTHTPMELKPISSLDNAVKLAAVCAVTGGCNGMDFDKSDNKIDFDNAYLCREDGYTLSSCPENYIKGAACPLDASWVKECISPETWCQNNGYNIKECLLPDYPDTSCPYSPEYYKTCKTDNVRACKEEGYSLVCDTGKVRDGNQVCSYDDSFAKCVCDPCIGFDYTIAQTSEQGYEPGEICNSCGTIKYKRVENACEGYKTCDCGGEVGADVCYSGTTQKFDTCKECCDASVYKYDISNCNNGYFPTGNSCGGKFNECQPIKLLYGDGSVSIGLDNNKKVIGIVFDESNRLAMAVTNVNQDGSATVLFDEHNVIDHFNSIDKEMPWAESPRNTINISGLENCVNTEELNICGVDGQTNTTAILKDTTIGTQYAAIAANKFSPDGCETDFCKSGNWFLPSMRDINNMIATRYMISNGGGSSNINPYLWFTNVCDHLWSSTWHVNGAWKSLNGYMARIYEYGKEECVQPVVKY